MFENIGGKIKTLAKACTWIGIGVSGLASLGLLFTNFMAGLLVFAVGALCSWIGSFMLYGFGQLIENTDRIAAAAERQNEVVG